ncbi:MAG: Translation initiation factor 6 [Methanomassiliicoccales archaeon PtaU1.Bin124]|nr:MAG: Translation initiation factor 6 [Methanomassiliicoccales archaeon PtaU1.Bin124]
MLKLSSYNGVEFLGVYCRANEELAFVPNDSEDSFLADFEEALGVKAERTTIAGTNLLGALVVMNSYGAVLTSMASDAETELFSKKLNVAKVFDRLNAVGNNVLANDNGAIVNPEMEDDAMKVIEDALQVECVRASIGGHKTVGSVCIATNKGVLCHPETTKAEFELIRSVLKVSPAIGTLNYGSPMLGASLVANSKGGMVGYRSTPIELGRVEDALSLY